MSAVLQEGAVGLPDLDEGGTTPDLADGALADMALVWQSCERDRLLLRKARTSVTSMRSSGASPSTPPPPGVLPPLLPLPLFPAIHITMSYGVYNPNCVDTRTVNQAKCNVLCTSMALLCGQACNILQVFIFKGFCSTFLHITA
jgi:hypothetical protein